MDIQAKADKHGANDALRIFADKLGDGLKVFLWCAGMALVLWVIGYFVLQIMQKIA